LQRIAGCYVDRNGKKSGRSEATIFGPNGLASIFEAAVAALSSVVRRYPL
jgi:hypothetical protein